MTSTNPTGDRNDPVTSARLVRLTDDQIRAGVVEFTACDRAESATFFMTPAQ